MRTIGDVSDEDNAASLVVGRHVVVERALAGRELGEGACGYVSARLHCRIGTANGDALRAEWSVLCIGLGAARPAETRSLLCWLRSPDHHLTELQPPQMATTCKQ